MRNHITVITFILLGLTDNSQQQILTLIFLLSTYMLSILGNLAILILILVDSHLKIVMCFFLQKCSFLKISFTSACIPRFLYSISSGDRTIIYNACVCQLFFTDLFEITEFFLLADVSYGCYVAICKPLHYMTIMNHRVYKRLIFCCWMTTVLIMIPPFSLELSLEFCDSNVLDHFFCDAKPVLKITCSDIWFMEKMVIISSALILIMILMFVVWSCVSIIQTLLRSPSTQQWKKEFSTCSSHMIVFPLPMAVVYLSISKIQQKMKWKLIRVCQY